MQKAIVIFKNELKTIVMSPIFLVILSTVAFIWSYVFVRSVVQFEQSVHASYEAAIGGGDLQAIVSSFLSINYVIFIFLIPIIAMKLIVEDKQNGSFNLLLFTPNSTWSIVLGKYLAGVCAVGLFLLMSLAYPLGVGQAIAFDQSLTLTAYFGMALLALTFFSVNALICSFLKSSFLAIILCVIANIGLLMIGDMSLMPTNEFFSEMLLQFSVARHFSLLSQGAVSVSSLAFFFSFNFLCIFLMEKVVSLSRWK